MRHSLFLFALFCSCQLFSQTRTVVKDSNAQSRADTISEFSEIVCGVGTEASTDLEKWTAYLSDNLVLDDASLDTIPAGKYTVFVQFAIDTKGRISDVMIVKDPGFGLGKKVKDVVSQCKVRWKPAEFYGRATPGYRIQPVTFTVEDEEECKEKLPGEYVL